MKLSNYLVFVCLSTTLSACNQSSSNTPNDLLGPNLHSDPLNCSSTSSTECQPELVRAPIPAKIRKILSPGTTNSALFPEDIMAFHWQAPESRSVKQYSMTVSMSIATADQQVNSIELFTSTCPVASTSASNEVTQACSEHYLVQCGYMPNNQNQLLCERRTYKSQNQSEHWLINLTELISTIPQRVRITFKACSDDKNSCLSEHINVDLN